MEKKCDAVYGRLTFRDDWKRQGDMKIKSALLKSVTAVVLLLVYASVGFAQEADKNSPVGVWRTIDDETGKANSHIKIWEKNGKIYGEIIKLIDPDEENPVCDECSGKLHNKPVLGMVIIRGLSKDGDKWSGGTILDARNGKTYKVYVKVQAGGNKLKVRGYIGFALIGRTKYWYRLG